MKTKQTYTLSEGLAGQLTDIGQRLARFRIARRIVQSEAAERAGISRKTASMIENGSPSIAVGQIFRYLHAIAPGCTLLHLLSGDDVLVAALEQREKRHRARELTKNELERLDF